MLYTVAEVSNLTSLSKVSIYNKLKLKELDPYISKKQGITYISEDGLNLIKDSLNLNDDPLNSLNNKYIDNTSNDEISTDTEDLNLKDDYIKYLKLENQRLWEELQEKNSQINGLNRLVENGQVLLKEHIKEDPILLEEHFQDLDNKLMDLRDQIEQRKNEQEQKGLFQKIFKE